MTNKVYVGNLSYTATEDDLRGFFSDCGSIAEVAIPHDRNTRRPRGFAFVSFEDASGASKAIEKNGVEFMGRTLKISAAEQKAQGGGGKGRGGDDRYSRHYN